MSSSRFARAIALLAVLFLAAFPVGCMSSGVKGRKCAIMFLVDGHQVRPTFEQFEAADKAFGPAMAERGFVLIHEFHEADYIATVEVRANPTDPSRTDLVLRDIIDNTITRADDRFAPSIIESIREHNEAFRGFTRPTD
jgi:hypothetical protein